MALQPSQNLSADCRGHVQLPEDRANTVGLGGLGVTCSPRDPRFVGSNPAEVDGFFQDVKILSTSPPGGLVKALQASKNRPVSKI